MQTLDKQVKMYESFYIVGDSNSDITVSTTEDFTKRIIRIISLKISHFKKP